MLARNCRPFAIVSHDSPFDNWRFLDSFELCSCDQANVVRCLCMKNHRMPDLDGLLHDALGPVGKNKIAAYGEIAVLEDERAGLKRVRKVIVDSVDNAKVCCHGKRNQVLLVSSAMAAL